MINSEEEALSLYLIKKVKSNKNIWLCIINSNKTKNKEVNSRKPLSKKILITNKNKIMIKNLRIALVKNKG